MVHRIDRRGTALFPEGLTTDALEQALAKPPRVNGHGVPLATSYPLATVSYERDGNYLRTKPHGILLSIEEDAKGPFVRIVHRAPKMLPEHEAASRLGAQTRYIPLTLNGRWLPKMNRRLRFNEDHGPFVMRVHLVVLERADVCEQVFAKGRERAKGESANNDLLTRLTRSLAEQTGASVPRKATKKRGNRERPYDGVPVRLQKKGPVLDVHIRETSVTWDGHLEHGGIVVPFSYFIVVDNDRDAYAQLLTALGELLRNPKIKIEDW